MNCLHWGVGTKCVGSSLKKRCFQSNLCECTANSPAIRISSGPLTSQACPPKSLLSPEVMHARTPVWLLCQLLPTQSCFSSWELLVGYRRALFLWLTIVRFEYINRIQVFSRQFHHICIRFSIGRWTLAKETVTQKSPRKWNLKGYSWLSKKNSWKRGSDFNSKESNLGPELSECSTAAVVLHHLYFVTLSV